jgi:hypothetical protein
LLTPVAVRAELIEARFGSKVERKLHLGRAVKGQTRDRKETASRSQGMNLLASMPPSATALLTTMLPSSVGRQKVALSGPTNEGERGLYGGRNEDSDDVRKLGESLQQSNFPRSVLGSQVLTGCPIFRPSNLRSLDRERK